MTIFEGSPPPPPRPQPPPQLHPVRHWWNHHRWPQITRSAVMFLAGLSFGVHEVWLTHSERPSVLIFAAGLMGLPVALWKDEKEKAA